MTEDFFSLPPFKPAEALLGLKRQLRELGLSERGAAFELKGSGVVQLASSELAIEARLAKRLIRTPEWAPHTLKSAADVRRFVDAVKRLLQGTRDDA
jgi:hypothetical protein